eukprot:9138023-Heterocapsa_arctica.AAC.1
MSGPSGNMIQGWALIRKSIKTDEPLPVNKCLGCEHNMFETTINSKPVRQMVYNMEPFMVSCVYAYLELSKKDRSSLKHTATPFLDEDK